MRAAVEAEGPWEGRKRVTAGPSGLCGDSGALAAGPWLAAVVSEPLRPEGRPGRLLLGRASPAPCTGGCLLAGAD